jgi:hypothetical protein
MLVAGPRSFDFAGVANFLGVSRFRVLSQKIQSLVLYSKKFKKKSQLAETVAAPCQNLANSTRPFTHDLILSRLLMSASK